MTLKWFVSKLKEREGREKEERKKNCGSNIESDSE